MPALALRNYIDGRWIDAAGGETFEDIDPATGELIATVAKSQPADVDRAIESAKPKAKPSPKPPQQAALR